MEKIRIDIYEKIVELINSQPELEICHESRVRTMFNTDKFNFIPRIGNGKWANDIDEIFLFEIENRPSRLTLQLVIGPGEQSIRKLINNIIMQKKELFTSARDFLHPKTKPVFKRDLLKVADYNMSEVEILNKVENEFKDFLETDYKEITNYMQEHKFELNK